MSGKPEKRETLFPPHGDGAPSSQKMAARVVPKSMDPRLAGVSGELAGALCVALVCYFLYRAGKSGR